jgi:Micrococcal nuclease (thermonuclease) homologs
MLKLKYYILLLSFLFTLNVFAQEYKGTVLRVIDGDTFVFQTDEGSLKVRMFGIDAPEKSQEFGQESKTFLEQYTHKYGTLRKTGIDKYGRTLGVLFVENTNVNLESVKLGFAWDYRYYNKDVGFAQAEKEAKEKRLGLWKNSNPTPPWEYRKTHKY